MSMVNTNITNYLSIQTIDESKNEQTGNLDQHLRDIALIFLKQSSFDIKEDVRIEGHSGNEYEIELFIKCNECNDLTSRMLVKILDFKKPAGTDVINKMEKISKDCRIKGLIISNKFSVQAISLASRIDSIQLLSRSELEVLLNSR